MPGPDGVESRAVIAENRKPGTTAWRITGAPRTGMIEGFADRNYVADGQSFGLYVSTTAPSFHVVAYRMGYYQGKGGRQVWSSTGVPGRRQPACPVDHSTNMVSWDNWSRSLTVRTTGAWTPGDYLRPAEPGLTRAVAPQLAIGHAERLLRAATADRSPGPTQ